MICLHYKNYEKFHLVYEVCKGWTGTEVWVIFRILQCQTLSTAFVTADLF